MKNLWQAWGKAIAALVFAGLTAAQAGLSDGRLSSVEDVQIVIAVVTAVGVWIIPIHPSWTWTKTATAALLAALNVLVTVIVGGLSVADLTEVGLAVLTVLGVAAAPATSRPSRWSAGAPIG